VNPNTTRHPPPTYSCDFLDLQVGVVAGLCDYAGVDLEADHEALGCNCDGCMCSGWPPPDLQYLHKFALESGFAATEEVCFSRNTGSGKVAIQVTDDTWKDQVTTGELIGIYLFFKSLARCACFGIKLKVDHLRLS
jgi:hypothetical protein